jgi:hypothetical protein
MQVASVMKWRDSPCISNPVYANRQDALRDLGVSEDQLESIAP